MFAHHALIKIKDVYVFNIILLNGKTQKSQYQSYLPKTAFRLSPSVYSSPCFNCFNLNYSCQSVYCTVTSLSLRDWNPNTFDKNSTDKNVEAGSANRRERLSTVDLLSPTCLALLLSIDKTFLTF
jgi:hypothetical protein